MLNLITKRILLGFIVVGGLFFSAGISRAAVLSLETENLSVKARDVILVNVKIDNQNECLNVVQASVKALTGVKILGTSQDGSILSLWPQAPTVNATGDELNFTGGVPGGYCGGVAGDRGAGNSIVKIFLKILDQSTTPAISRLEFVENKNLVLLNDGLGTAAKLSFKNLDLNISAPSQTPTDAWQSELSADQIPPEKFEITPTRDPRIFDNQYFIYFSTTDKQTGVAYYEVSEGDGAWTRATSPYLLKNQKLDVVIRVRAVDWAGNQTLAQYQPVIVSKVLKKSSFFIWVGGSLLILLIIVAVILKLNKKRSNPKHYGRI